MSHRSKAVSISDSKSEVDLTPMLDVVFIMLIFFVVTASFISESSLQFNTPKTSPKPAPPGESILIQVNANDEIFINNRRVQESAVRSLVAQMYAENPENTVSVRMHEDARASTYVYIADAARQAKVRDISMVPYSD